MIQQNEVIMLLLGIGCFLFIVLNKEKVKRIPAPKTLIAGFYVLLTSYILTIIEGFFWQDFFNLLEHICYAISSILFAIWCWKIFVPKKDNK